MSLMLHGYWRSTASYRVRIALNLKGVVYEQAAHDLRTGFGSLPYIIQVLVYHGLLQLFQRQIRGGVAVRLYQRTADQTWHYVHAPVDLIIC